MLATSGRALMIRGTDPADPERGSFWFTPGGGLDPGESLEAGTRRELREELGLVAPLGPVVMTRVNEFPMAGEWYRQTETVFLVEVGDEFTPAPEHLEELELSVIDEFGWLGSAQMRSLGEPVYPMALPDLLDAIRTEGPPSDPWTEEITRER